MAEQVSRQMGDQPKGNGEARPIVVDDRQQSRLWDRSGVSDQRCYALCFTIYGQRLQ
jgi:hypothetical protein